MKSESPEDSEEKSSLTPVQQSEKASLKEDDDSIDAIKDAMANEESAAASFRWAPTSPERRPHSSRVGAQAIHGMHSYSGDVETGTVIVGGGTVAHAEPVEDDGLEEEIREEIQAEIRGELNQAHIPTAEAVDSSVTKLKNEDKSSICTAKRRVLIVVCLVSLAVVGVIVGLMVKRGNKEESDPNTIQGLSADGERFGDFIVLSRDGKTLAVGSDKDSYARVFRRNENSKEWRQIGQTLYGDGQFVSDCGRTYLLIYFCVVSLIHLCCHIVQGRTMDFNRNGSMLVVGSWSNDVVGEKAGKAQVFRYNGTGWDLLGQEFFGDSSQDRYVSDDCEGLILR